MALLGEILQCGRMWEESEREKNSPTEGNGSTELVGSISTVLFSSLVCFFQVIFVCQNCNFCKFMESVSHNAFCSQNFT